MQAIPTTDPFKVGQIGTQLWTTFFLFDQAIANPEMAALDEYERMIMTDETIATAFDFTIMAVINKMGEYQHPDPKIKSFVQSNLEQMEGSLPLACQEILSALWAGHSVTEMIYKTEGSRIMLDYLATYHPRTILYRVNEKGRLLEDGIYQTPYYGGVPVIIPTKKCIRYVHNSRFGNKYGTSNCKKVRKNWLLKDPVLKMWARALDRFGTPLLSVVVPNDEVEDEEGNRVALVDHTVKVLNNLQNSTSLVFQKSGDDSIEIQTHNTGASGMSDAFRSIVNYLNKMIFRGWLVPSLVFDDGSGTGSYALGQSHFDIFTHHINGIYNNLTETLLEQMIRPLVEINYGKQTEYGSFPERSQGDADVKLLSEMFLQMTNAGYLDPDAKEDFNHVRASLSLPERKPSVTGGGIPNIEHYWREGGDPASSTSI